MTRHMGLHWCVNCFTVGLTTAFHVRRSILSQSACGKRPAGCQISAGAIWVKSKVTFWKPAKVRLSSDVNFAWISSIFNPTQKLQAFHHLFFSTASLCDPYRSLTSSWVLRSQRPSGCRLKVSTEPTFVVWNLATSARVGEGLGSGAESAAESGAKSRNFMVF